MLKFLNKPYPFNDDLRHNAKIIFFISIGILAFLILFQPIRLENYSKIDLFYLVTGLAASTFLTLTLNLIVLPSLFPNILNNKKWNIKREVFWNLWILLTISTSDILFYTKLFEIIEISFMDVGKVLLLGFLPVATLIIVNQDRLLRSHLKSAQQLNEKLLESKQQKEKLIHFKSKYKNDELILKAEALLLIKSSDNYIEIFYLSNGSIDKQMVRSTMKMVELTLKDNQFIVRCHRTFFVNVNHIVEIQGNSQGYKLKLDGLNFPVFVSPKYIPDFKKRI